ncbi:MAG: hypothetical protein CEN90_474 [Parcubacteria group bacterium Licking1014_17]|nr:MAG: hypothetical protein CEN90_474 [Parcubacteria group bacterium Licking1014_17]
MMISLKYSAGVLRWGMAVVFLWLGVNAFVNPTYWLTAYLPKLIATAASNLGLAGSQFAYVGGVFLIVTGISLITEIFIVPFCFAGIIMLVLSSVSSNVLEITIRNVGLIAGLIFLIMKPDIKQRY